LIRPEERLARLGHTLPGLSPRAGNYQGYIRHGDLLFLSGQGAQRHRGRVGHELTLDQGRAAARECMLSLLAQTRDALGSLDRIAQVIKVVGFVACDKDFVDTPKVIDGASDLVSDLLGERGTHARSVIGAQSQPLGCAVEIEMTVAIAATGGSA
jgi:enamine deaminase RidA (YjgF/YER057c/UK114 family)